MSSFTFETTPRLLCEIGGVQRLGQLARDLGIKKALLVTDSGLVAAGLLAAPQAALDAAGVQVELFQEVQADPPQASIEAAIASAREAGVDGVIGLGGGSSLDTAKLAALLCGQDQALPEIYGIGLAKGPPAPARRSRRSPSSLPPATRKRAWSVRCSIPTWPCWMRS